ncbi:MAG: hypothetical protein K6E51_08665 [Treponema sp.]|nr:hypothetical protein [Treponema sp.]
MVVPVPGRFAFGVVLVISFNFIILFGTLFLHALYKLHQESLKTIILVPFLIGISVFVQQLLCLFFPYVIFALGILVFVPALSVFIISLFYLQPCTTIKSELTHNCVLTAFFSAVVLFYMLVRDILGYGTISFPVPAGIKEFMLFDASMVPFTAFFASVPGILTTTVLCFVIATYCKNKLMIVSRAEKIHG